MRKNYVTGDCPKNPWPMVCWLMLLGALVFVLSALTGCKTKERVVTVEHVRTDTTYITKELRDSIWLHDSTYRHEWASADTIYVLQEKWHTKYKEKLVRDTIYQAKVDSVPVPYKVEVAVEKPLKGWQKGFICWGVACAAGAMVWLWLKLRGKAFP